MKEESSYKHLFGPVPSRRLGMSLGIDLIPHKICSMNCIYCECGATNVHTRERKEYVPLNELYSELDDYFSKFPDPDYLTFSGNGEPTLHSGMGQVIAYLKKVRPEARVAILTNASLFGDPQVRKEAARADLVLPSLDAATDAALVRINRPAGGLKAADYVDGLLRFAEEFNGKIWLEILIMPGYNDDPDNLEAIKKVIHKMQPERVQLNALDRPGTVADLPQASREQMEEIAAFLDMEEVEIIASFKDRKDTDSGSKAPSYENNEAAILETISRRPCTMEDLSSMLGIEQQVVKQIIKGLLREDRVVSSVEDRGVFYHPPRKG